MGESSQGTCFRPSVMLCVFSRMQFSSFYGNKETHFWSPWKPRCVLLASKWMSNTEKQRKRKVILNVSRYWNSSKRFWSLVTAREQLPPCGCVAFPYRVSISWCIFHPALSIHRSMWFSPLRELCLFLLLQKFGSRVPPWCRTPPISLSPCLRDLLKAYESHPFLCSQTTSAQQSTFNLCKGCLALGSHRKTSDRKSVV